MPLRIVIDVRRVRDFGIGTYIRNLIQSLGELDAVNRYTLIAGGELDYPEFAALPANFQLARFWPREQGLTATLTLPVLLRRLKPDLIHIPWNNVPFGVPHPYLVTVHDMGSLLSARDQGLPNTLRLSRLRQGLINAAKLITVSNATRRDVETLLGIPGRRIRTVYNAPDPAFNHTPDPPDTRILDRYQIAYPFLLYAGRTNPHKNISRLVEAFAVVRTELAAHPFYRDLRLIIIGDEISKYPYLRHAVHKSRVEDAVRFLGYVPIETLRVFYQAAEAFVFPSLYEGFGLPPLEAMACGTPVVASNVSALPEVVGDAAQVVNPENVFDIARGIREVLLDRQLRATLVRRGFDQVKRFSWADNARQVLETYQQTYHESGRGAARAVR